MPMDNNSTQLPVQSLIKNSGNRLRSKSPKKDKIDFIRQFARVYMPVSSMPGIVLN